MVRQDDWLESLADLAGKTIGLPPPLAAVSELVKASLLDAGLVPGVDVNLEHYRSKPSCLQALAIGRVDACGLPRFALLQIDPNNDLRLRLMFETEAVNNFVFAAHARVPEDQRVNLCNSILAWPFTAKGRKILAGGAWSRFVPALDQDYDEVRQHRLRMQRFAQR
jgi:phosphonate transport system substrate-binding protein